MALITQTGSNKTAQAILDHIIDHGELVIDGAPRDINIYDYEVEDNTLSIYFLLENNIDGTVEEARLIDIDGDIYAKKTDYIEKPSERLFMVTFRFNVLEEEVNS